MVFFVSLNVIKWEAGSIGQKPNENTEIKSTSLD